MSLEKYLKERKALIEAGLNEFLPPEREYPDIVHKAMRYAVFTGGKRLRPILAVATAEVVSGKDETKGPALKSALAVELVHASSLILDDLPSMDNASLRRGKPTVHLEFGESTAVLAAYALLVKAFELLGMASGEFKASPEASSKAVMELSRAVGTQGMVGGQQVDLLAGKAEGTNAPENELKSLEYIHSHKTGALFIASAILNPILMNARERDTAAIAAYAKNLGLAFQVVDDILDTRNNTGKESGKDQGKLTFVSLMGVEAARQIAVDLIESAKAPLTIFNRKATILEDIAQFVIDRKF